MLALVVRTRENLFHINDSLNHLSRGQQAILIELEEIRALLPPAAGKSLQTTESSGGDQNRKEKNSFVPLDKILGDTVLIRSQEPGLA